MTKPTKWHMRPAKTQISVFAVHLMDSLGPNASSGSQRRQIRPADAQADLSLRWAHRSFGWFCRVAAHLSFKRCLIIVFIIIH